MYCALLGCSGLYWAVLGCIGLYWIQVVQVVRVVRIISLDAVHSENVWVSWSKPSNYQEKLRCHARDGGKEKKRL